MDKAPLIPVKNESQGRKADKNGFFEMLLPQMDAFDLLWSRTLGRTP